MSCIMQLSQSTRDETFFNARSSMRKVFSSNDMPEVVLVRDSLLHNGIPATIQNQYSGFEAVPAFRVQAEVWVEDSVDPARAQAIVDKALARIDGETTEAPWTCGACGEQNPARFEICWSCGSARETSAAD
jgi:hypothetical protein